MTSEELLNVLSNGNYDYEYLVLEKQLHYNLDLFDLDCNCELCFNDHHKLVYYFHNYNMDWEIYLMFSKEHMSLEGDICTGVREVIPRDELITIWS